MVGEDKHIHCAKHSAKHLVDTISFNPQNNPILQMSKVMQREGKELAKVQYGARGRDGTCTQAF